MKQPVRLILFVLLACSLSSAAGAVEPAAGNPAPKPSLLPAAPQTVITETQKKAEAEPAKPAVRMGHVDLMRISSDSEKGKAGQAQLAALRKKLQGQLETRRKQLDKQKAAIEATLKTMTAQQREAKGKAFQKKVEEFQKFGLNAEKELQEQQEELSSKLFKAIEQASTEFGKANGLALVVVKRELLYLGSGVDAQDVTDEVIKLIDKK